MPHMDKREDEHCKHGHAFTAKNTRFYRGLRICRQCRTDVNARYKQRKRDGALEKHSQTVHSLMEYGVGTPRNVLTQEFIEDRVERMPWSGCWIWSNNGCNGYGKLGYRGRWVRAHRASWFAYFGEIPQGKYVLHRCDVKACVNPAHLFLGTKLENTRDAFAKGRVPHAIKGSFPEWKRSLYAY